jgi:hypothetical protein
MKDTQAEAVVALAGITLEEHRGWKFVTLASVAGDGTASLKENGGE